MADSLRMLEGQGAPSVEETDRACLATVALVHCLWNCWRVCLVGWSQRDVTKVIGKLGLMVFFFSVFYDALTFWGFADLGEGLLLQGYC